MSERKMGISYNKGKQISIETKRKISLSKSGKKNLNSSSKYIGVSFAKLRNKFYSSILLQKRKTIGYFQTEIEAALAYNEYASEYFGWKANLNIITDEEIQKIWED